MLPAIQQSYYSERAPACVAMDRNGYIGTHMEHLSKPQSDDPVWNMANCRNRRLFNDRVAKRPPAMTTNSCCRPTAYPTAGASSCCARTVRRRFIVKGRKWGCMRLTYLVE